MTASVGSSVIARADGAYRTCIEASDGSNQAWLQCGNALVDGEKRKFEVAWNALIDGQKGRPRDGLFAEHRTWLQFSDAACEFYNNGDLGREGQVLSYPTYKAKAYADRTIG
ncbi:lysozyme inhibitor LprI family protein [Mesorhizobium sp. A556]